MPKLELFVTKKQLEHMKSKQMSFFHYFNEYYLWGDDDVFDEEKTSTPLLGDLKDYNS